MQGFFKGKRDNSEDDFELALQSVMSALRSASDMAGIERLIYTAAAIGSGVAVMKTAQPNIPIESDGPAMTILSADLSPAHFDAALADVEHVLQQAAACPKDKYSHAAVMQYFLAPRHVQSKMQKLQADQALQRSGLNDPLENDGRLR